MVEVNVRRFEYMLDANEHILAVVLVIWINCSNFNTYLKDTYFTQ
jgi:hypothetical protein